MIRKVLAVPRFCFDTGSEEKVVNAYVVDGARIYIYNGTDKHQLRPLRFYNFMTVKPHTHDRIFGR